MHLCQDHPANATLVVVVVVAAAVVCSSYHICCSSKANKFVGVINIDKADEIVRYEEDNTDRCAFV